LQGHFGYSLGAGRDFWGGARWFHRADLVMKTEWCGEFIFERAKLALAVRKSCLFAPDKLFVEGGGMKNGQHHSEETRTTKKHRDAAKRIKSLVITHQPGGNGNGFLSKNLYELARTFKSIWGPGFLFDLCSL